MRRDFELGFLLVEGFHYLSRISYAAWLSPLHIPSRESVSVFGYRIDDLSLNCNTHCNTYHSASCIRAIVSPSEHGLSRCEHLQYLPLSFTYKRTSFPSYPRRSRTKNPKSPRFPVPFRNQFPSPPPKKSAFFRTPVPFHACAFSPDPPKKKKKGFLRLGAERQLCFSRGT